MTFERLAKIRNAINVLSTISGSEWAELLTVTQEKPKEEEFFEASSENINKSLFERTTNLLHRLSVPANVMGYAYLRSAIIYCIEADNYVAVTKELYPAIAREFDTTPTRVERCIRHAVGIAIERGNPSEIEKIFGDVEKYNKEKPSNSVAIATLAEYLKFNMD